MQGLYHSIAVAPTEPPQATRSAPGRTFSALSTAEQESIDRYQRAELALSDLPSRARVFVRRHLAE